MMYKPAPLFYGRPRRRLSLRAEGWLVAGLAALVVLAVELLPDLVAGWIF